MEFETTEVKVTYGLVSKMPHEGNIVQAIREMGADGWRLIERVDGLGLNIVGMTYTLLVFQRPKREW